MPRAPKTSSLPAPLAAPPAPPRLFAGTSGWAYPTWKPGFYPANVPAKKFLQFYASQLNSVEVNYTFRALPTAKMLEGWLNATPSNFRFTFKAPQRITHFKRLRDCESDVLQFVASLAPVTTGRLGLLLFQLPPNFKADDDNLARLASFLKIPALRTVSIAFEFRNPSFFADPTYAILREHDAALCIAESDDLATPEVHTSATHTSFRLRRTAGYTPDEISAFATRFTNLAGARGGSDARDVYIYFKHEEDPTGALNAADFLSQSAALADSR